MSAFVKKTAAMRDSRFEVGCSDGNDSICCGRSGDALTSNQFPSATLIAIDDSVSFGILPERASRQFRQAQFNCGSPPPAAVPRSRIRINAIYFAQIGREHV